MNINDNKHVPRPDLSLGAFVITIDIDTRKCSVAIDNSQTMQLTTPEELVNILPKTGINLFCDELRRRSKKNIVV